ncbi:hypothetical protein [Candidatus Pristimantibacillus sp. PTI5]|uniref:hypothetical protein n=1 Tax=Candidatus Pristimantibacillus sp. PTI5 TaxID=3400422 RepID=UPI003B02DB2E
MNYQGNTYVPMRSVGDILVKISSKLVIGQRRAISPLIRIKFTGSACGSKGESEIQPDLESFPV